MLQIFLTVKKFIHVVEYHVNSFIELSVNVCNIVMDWYGVVSLNGHIFIVAHEFIKAF